MDYETQYLIIYAGLIAMTVHPGYNRPDTKKPSLETLAQLAHAAMSAKDKT